MIARRTIRLIAKRRSRGLRNGDLPMLSGYASGNVDDGQRIPSAIANINVDGSHATLSKLERPSA